MNRKALFVAALVTATALAAVSAAFAASPLVNPGFETGTLSDWDSDSWGAGEWNTTSSGEAFCGGTTNAPFEGSYSALWDMDEPSGGLLWQNFTVPASGDLSFAFAYDNLAGEWAQDADPYDIEASDNQWLRIDVIESSAEVDTLDPGDIVATAFDSQAGSPPFSQGWQNVTLSLAGRVGDTLTLRVASVDTLFCMPVWIDDATAGATTQINRLGYCSVVGNTDANGTAIAPGTFLDLAVNQPATDPHYKGALAAIYYQGKGISCDNLPGYTKTNELVGYGGHGDTGPYSYYTKN